MVAESRPQSAQLFVVAVAIIKLTNIALVVEKFFFMIFCLFRLFCPVTSAALSDHGTKQAVGQVFRRCPNGFWTAPYTRNLPVFWPWQCLCRGRCIGVGHEPKKWTEQLAEVRNSVPF